MTQVLLLLDERVLRGFLTFSSGVLSGEGTVASPVLVAVPVVPGDS